MHNKLKELRINAKMSQEELAERMGVSRSCISSWETGARKPGTYQIMKYHKVFKLKNNFFNPSFEKPTYNIGKCFDISVLNCAGVKKLCDYFTELTHDEKYVKKY